MSDLQTVLDAIDRLPPDELEQVREHIKERRQNDNRARRLNEDVEERIAGIREALAEFREGLTAEELNDLVNAIRLGYISPKELALYDWLDDLPENER
jgi:hypothetical protein